MISPLHGVDVDKLLRSSNLRLLVVQLLEGMIRLPLAFEAHSGAGMDPGVEN